MNVSIFSKMAYEYKHNWTLSKNKPNQTQSQDPTPKGVNWLDLGVFVDEWLYFCPYNWRLK